MLVRKGRFEGVGGQVVEDPEVVGWRSMLVWMSECLHAAFELLGMARCKLGEDVNWISECLNDGLPTNTVPILCFTQLTFFCLP